MAEIVVLLGSTGTIGRATARALRADGYDLRTPNRADLTPEGLTKAMSGARAVISCLASRTGAAKDAWAVDHGLNASALAAAKAAGVEHFTLLSAICVQRPKLPFQKAKLAFEAELQASELSYSIVRPTAFFKSLSGQVARVQAGKPYLVFGDGTLTACKPISDDDLARFLARTLTDPDLTDRILPIGGPGPALTPLDQAAILSDLLGQDIAIRRISPHLLRVIATLCAIVPPLRAKADLARIGHYYATESMLVWDRKTGRYTADATPKFGTDTLRNHYAALLSGEEIHDSEAHGVF